MENEIVGGLNSDAVFETKTYTDGSSATGVAPLPDHSPDGATEDVAATHAALSKAASEQLSRLASRMNAPAVQQERDFLTAPIDGAFHINFGPGLIVPAEQDKQDFEALYNAEVLAHAFTKVQFAAAEKAILRARAMGFSGGAGIHLGA